jgi:integrase
MSVYMLTDRPHGKPRTLPWRAVVPRQGQKPLIKQFASKAEAIIWESEFRKQERLKDAPEYKYSLELKHLRQHSVRELIYDYIKSNPTLNTNNVISLNQFARENICSKSVLDFSTQDVHRWIAKKKNETWKPPNSKGEPRPITPRTVRRQANIVQRVFEHAREQREGFRSLPNPFRGIKIEGSTGGRRQRALEEGELERILEACKACHEPNNYYVPLAIWLAIYTGMRRQEIFNLLWSDIDDNNRRITIRKQKTDKLTGNVGIPTTIVLPAMALHLLITLVAVLFRESGEDEGEEWAFPSLDARIFPMTEKAFTQSWSDVVKRAGIEDLQFHDLRREAQTRFIRAGLTVQEQNLMMRHADKSMNAVYIGRNTLLKDIQDKLDRYALNGLTYEEALEKGEVDFGKLLESDMALPVRKLTETTRPRKAAT